MVILAGGPLFMAHMSKEPLRHSLRLPRNDVPSSQSEIQLK